MAVCQRESASERAFEAHLIEPCEAGKRWTRSAPSARTRRQGDASSRQRERAVRLSSEAYYGGFDASVDQVGLQKTSVTRLAFLIKIEDDKSNLDSRQAALELLSREPLRVQSKCQFKPLANGLKYSE